jgi:hypothetical protein
MTAYHRSTDPGAQTIVPNIDMEGVAPGMGFSGVYSPVIPSLQHLPPPPSATPSTFILGPLNRATGEASGKVQGVSELTQPAVDIARRGRDRGRTEAGLMVARVRSLLGR